jgi:hypothetical protein
MYHGDSARLLVSPALGDVHDQTLPAHHRLLFETGSVDGVVTVQLGELVRRGGVCVVVGRRSVD